MESMVNFYPCLDIAKTTDFYLNVMGLKLWRDQGTCKIFDSGYGYLGFCEYDHHETATHTCISFNVSSEAEVQKMHEYFQTSHVAGLTAPQKHPKYPVYSFFFRNPNGYTIEIQYLY